MKIPVSKATQKAIARSVFRSEREEQQAATRAISDKITALLPDDPRAAIAALALNYAATACCVGLDDSTALEAVRVALRQMREHGVGQLDS